MQNCATGWDSDGLWMSRNLSDVTIIDTEPVDEHGCLVHAEDATAQLCLALARLGSELGDRGQSPSAITRIRVFALDGEDAIEFVEVVAEWLDGAAAEIACLHVERLPVDGMLAAISADVTAPGIIHPTLTNP